MLSFISFQLVDTKLDAVSIHNYYFVWLVMSGNHCSANEQIIRTEFSDVDEDFQKACLKNYQVSMQNLHFYSITEQNFM